VIGEAERMLIQAMATAPVEERPKDENHPGLAERSIGSSFVKSPAELLNSAPRAVLSRNKISGFVVSYNRAQIIETCLRSLQFVDELIVVDKSSTDGALEMAQRYADKVVVIPWTPTADDTRDLCAKPMLSRPDRLFG
jgi:hypothetical protein